MASEYDYRPEIRRYGDRQVEVVSGKAYSAAASSSPHAVVPAGSLRLSPDHTAGGGRGGSASVWCFSDPEMRRKKRVASYKMYSVEGKIKSSFRRGFRWIKSKCSELVHGRH